MFKEIIMLSLDPRHTALVLIDLQKGIVGFARHPYTATEVVTRSATLAARIRDLGAPVVRVRVGFSPDGRDMLASPTDTPPPTPEGGLPADWLDDPEGLPAQAGDIAIVKRQWNAFHGTELDLQLRRRGIEAIVLGGLVTPFGVESTARAGWELGYHMVIAEDLCSAPQDDLHRFSMTAVMPRIARVRSTREILAAMA